MKISKVVKRLQDICLRSIYSVEKGPSVCLKIDKKCLRDNIEDFLIEMSELKEK